MKKKSALNNCTSQSSARKRAGQKHAVQKQTKQKQTKQKLGTSKPMMFRDESIAEKLKTATKISDLMNLGPSSEAAFRKAGIKTVQQFMKLGWKKVMAKLVKENPKNRHSIFAYAVIGAEKNIIWNKISEADKVEAREYMKSLKK